MNRQQTFLGLMGYFFIGTGAILIPSVMPSITAEFAATGLALAAIGLIFPASAVGGILGNLLAGLGSDLIGRRRMVWLAALVLAVALGLTASATLWPLFVAGFVLVSATQGSLSTGINAMIADANRAARARALNTLHGVYGMGATVSPLVIGYFLEQGLHWRWALGATGLIWLLYALTAYGSGRRAASGEQPPPAQRLDLSMLRQTPFLALFLIGFIYNGIAVSLLGWIALIMQESAGFSTLVSVSMVSVFYMALTAGRFFCAAFAERIGYARILLVLAVGITLTYPLVVLGIHSLLLVTTGVFLTGLSLSGLFPMAIAFASRLYPGQTGALSGALSVSLTIGSMVPPLWTAVFAGLWGFQIALGINFLMAPPLIVLALYLGRVEGGETVAQPASTGAMG